VTHERMLVPTRAEFHALAKTGKLVPVYREVFADHDTPVSAFRKLDDGPYGYLLESVEGGEKWGRYSFLGGSPSAVVRLEEDFGTKLANWSGIVDDFRGVDGLLDDILRGRTPYRSANGNGRGRVGPP